MSEYCIDVVIDANNQYVVPNTNNMLIEYGIRLIPTCTHTCVFPLMIDAASYITTPRAYCEICEHHLNSKQMEIDQAIV